MWTQPQLNRPVASTISRRSLPSSLTERRPFILCEALPSSRSIHCRTKQSVMLRLRRPRSCVEVRQLFKVQSNEVHSSPGNRNAPVVGAVSAHAHDQSPDHSGWIVMDDLQGAALQFRCHASPFGRDNRRLLGRQRCLLYRFARPKIKVERKAF